MANINDQMNRGATGLTLTNATAAATNVLTAGVRIMKVLVNNGAVAGSVTVWNSAATTGTAGFTVTSVANGSAVLDLAPDGFVIVGGAVSVTGTTSIFTVAE